VQILEGLDRLERAIRRPRGDSRRTVTELEFFSKNLERHIQREENTLFPILSKVSAGGQATAPIADEHKKIRTFLRSLVEPSRSSPDPALFKRLADAIRGHVSREEKVLFWFAEVKVRGRTRQAGRMTPRSSTLKA